MKKKIILSGGTGFIGRHLVKFLLAEGYKVAVLSREITNNTMFDSLPVELVQWNGKDAGDWTGSLEESHAVINLAGENIASGLWTKRKKERIMESRINSGKALAIALKETKRKPKVFIQASATGYYGNGAEEKLNEKSPMGSGFLADVCLRTEESSAEVDKMGIRRVVIRTGGVLSRDGGFLEKIIPAFRFHMGNIPGSGGQWFSWIHLSDEIRAVKFLMENRKSRGVYNLTSPDPVTMEVFIRKIGELMHRPVRFKIPEVILKTALGDMAREVLLLSQKVYPERLKAEGYKFTYPDIEAATNEIFLR